MSLFGWYRATPVNLTSDEATKKRTLAGLEADNDKSTRAPWQASSSPEARIRDMLSMTESDLVGPLLEVYAEEASQPDVNKGRALWYECNDSEVEKDLNEMLDRIGAEDYMVPIVINVAGTGNEFRRVLFNEEGVQQLPGVKADEVKRLWDPTTRRLVGFKWREQKPREEDVIYAQDKTVFPPWHFIHFRRLYRSDTEYGIGVLDKLYPLWRKLEQSIDQMVVYRRHIMPSRLKMVVDTQDQDIVDAMETIHIFQTFIRQQMVKNQQGLESRFAPAALDSILYVPLRGADDKTSMDVLKGDTDVPDVPDIEQLLSMLYGGARIPKAYMGQDDGDGLAKASLVSQDIRFARVIRTLRRSIVSGFYRLAQLHLLFKGKNPEDYNVQVRMSRISTIEEEVNVAILEKQAALSRDIADLCQQLEIPNREIIDLIFREYLSVPRYFLDVAKLGVSLQRALGDDSDGGDFGGGGGGFGGFGDDFGMDDFSGGEPGPEGPGGPGGELEPSPGPEPQMASARGRKSTLAEACVPTDARTCSRLIAACDQIKEARKRSTARQRHQLINSVRGVCDVLRSGRSSLVEDFGGAPVDTEAVVAKGVRHAGERLVEAMKRLFFGNSTQLTESLGEALKLEVALQSEDPEEQQHESVQIKARMKNGHA